MNWAPEALLAEIDYRVERALGDRKTTLAHRRAAEHAHQPWWHRNRTNHTHHNKPNTPQAA